MRSINLSHLITGILFYKITNFKKIIQKNKRFFSNYFKYSSQHFKKFFFFNETVLLRFCQTDKINWDFLKIILNYDNFEKIKLLTKKLDIFKIFSFSRKGFALYFEIFFQYHSDNVKKNNLLSGFMLNKSLNLVSEIKKIPSLRIVLSGLPFCYIKKINKTMYHLSRLFLENPFLSSKTFSQEIIWNYFRIKSARKLIFFLLLETRSLAFLNNTKKSIFFFSLVVTFFPQFLAKPLVNFSLKNAYHFIKGKFGYILILYIFNNFFFERNIWINSSVLKNLFQIKIISSKFMEVFFFFLFRKTANIFRKNPQFSKLFNLDRNNKKSQLIEWIVSRKSINIIDFLNFFRNEIFKKIPSFYPNSLQKEFIAAIDMVIINKKSYLSGGENKFPTLPIFVSDIEMVIKKKLLFSQTIKIKKCLPFLLFRLFMANKILRHFLLFLKKKIFFEKNLFQLFCQIHSKKTCRKSKLIMLLKLPINTSPRSLIYLYKNNNLFENQ